MNPTTYSVGNTYCPIFNTRYGPGQPIFYLSLIRGNPRIMLYNDTGSLILDESVDPPFSLVNGGWYFIACLIDRTTRRRSMWWATGAAARCGHRRNFPLPGN